MTSNKKILLVDDDEALRNSLAEQLHLHEEFATSEAQNAAAGVKRFQSTPKSTGAPSNGVTTAVKAAWAW